ncbi:D-erythronate dehydrogenase [Polymorphum gilvum]|uniref:Probable UDP-glucose 4-epimerase protein n=1 Tax=Polymorphum gilvum (strain LMG 25793 / CGMCC 1.9160 / SL003B-26A1) TaxID=991905 RepID=F2IZK3_POLGS|nr:D-erythronate dehydrogenase [Polymorphum gilvum]ADZ69560.1 Probable UDP-glucose 4-epimerase protein [Polymorphum gilvum SL003B-26A1]
MTSILIIGGGGMLGQGLARALAASGSLAGRTIDLLTLFDVMTAAAPSGPVSVEVSAGDLAAGGAAERLIEGRPQIIYHLAAVVSGEAERDFDKGYRVNLDGTQILFEAIRAEHLRSGYCPRVVFASSLAVFGAPLPDVIGDDQVLTPMTSYGTQKAIGELLLADYSRRGFFDGIGLRLPTICIRPGKPNAAASGFFSGILREPLAGEEAVLPVNPAVRHWFASPRAAVGYLLHAAELDTRALGGRRNLTMPGISATVADEIEALRRVAGDEAVALIRHEPDPAIEAIISTWPKAFDTRRALDLGFRPDASFTAIVETYLEDHAQDAPQ